MLAVFVAASMGTVGSFVSTGICAVSGTGTAQIPGASDLGELEAWVPLANQSKGKLADG